MHSRGFILSQETYRNYNSTYLSVDPFLSKLLYLPRYCFYFTSPFKLTAYPNLLLLSKKFLKRSAKITIEMHFSIYPVLNNSLLNMYGNYWKGESISQVRRARNEKAYQPLPISNTTVIINLSQKLTATFSFIVLN